MRTENWTNRDGWLYDENGVCRGHGDPVGEPGAEGVIGKSRIPRKLKKKYKKMGIWSAYMLNNNPEIIQALIALGV